MKFFVELPAAGTNANTSQMMPVISAGLDTAINKDQTPS